MILRSETERRFVTSLGLLSLLCLGLLAFRIISTHSTKYLFIPGNLALAWASLVFVWLLARGLQRRRWKSWPNGILTALWLIFLPNSWYVLTDLIHVYPSGQISELYDIALVGSLVLCGFFLGFTSLYLFHRELLKRFNRQKSLWIIEGVILLSSFAIYLGRILRWNSWDVIKNPGGLILNITDRIVDPFAHVSSFAVTALFFVTLSVMYLAFWIFVQPEAHSKPHLRR
jgi:uncharacterized membrane protein